MPIASYPSLKLAIDVVAASKISRRPSNLCSCRLCDISFKDDIVVVTREQNDHTVRSLYEVRYFQKV